MSTFGDWGTWVGDFVGAGAATAVFLQLRNQNKQLKEQHQTIADEAVRNRKRDDLLDKQLRELELRERAIVRQQAEQVDVQLRSSGPPPGIIVDDGDEVHAVHVINNSPRPVHHVSARIDPNRAGGLSPASSRARLGQGEVRTTKGDPVWNFKTTSEVSESDRVPLVRSGETWMLVFAFSVKLHPSPAYLVRFTDDAGIHWQVNDDMHLETIENRAPW